VERLPVTVSMIVRDEAEVLAVALASVVEWAAEVVVVDTGSSDSSLDVARRAGAVVRSIEWTDDFSAARNVSIDVATQPWVLIFDADEWIDPEDVPRIAALLAGDPSCAYRFAQHNYVDSPSYAGVRLGAMPPVWGLEAVGWVVARQVRLIPNHPDLRYEGAVHETLVPSLERAGVRLADAEIPVHHVGKLRAAAVMARKKRLYKRLGEAKFAADPSGMASMELGIQCSELGEIEEARRLLTLACERLPSGPERARAAACLASQIEELDGADAAIGFLHAELVREATNADLWERLGIVMMRAGQFARAAEVLERAMNSFPEASNLVRLAAECELVVRQFDRAVELYDSLAKISDDSGVGVPGGAVARAGRGDPSAVLECLASSRPAVATGASIGAERWLDPAWVQITGPGAWRRVPRERAARHLRRFWVATGRSAAAQATGPDPSTAVRCGVEALEGTLRGTVLPENVAASLARSLGTPRWAPRAEAALTASAPAE
jgi:tetratricopeptide (TPR) repeat protein